MSTGTVTIAAVVAAMMSLCHVTSGARVLLIPVAHYSHVNFFTIAAKALQDAGHEVTVLVHDKHGSRADKAGVPALKYPLSDEADLSAIAGKVLSGKTDMGIFQIIGMFSGMKGSLNNFCVELLGNEKIMNEIQKTKFDLAIVDSFPIMTCIHIIPYKFNVPFIHLGPFQTPWAAGVSVAPPHEPPIIVPIKEKFPNLGQRVGSVLTHFVMEYLFSSIVSFNHVTTYAPNKPYKTINELAAEAGMTLITIDTTCFDIPRISSPNYRFIGSLSGSAATKPLIGEFKTFADSATSGLIVVSFGSLTSARQGIIIHISKLLEALGRVKEKAILQFTVGDLSGMKIPDNVLVQEWLPQTDLLAHPNTKLFVAHGGLNGHLEATYHGVPILTLPYQSEQERNGARAQIRKQGKLLKWAETNADEIHATIRELIDNPEYKQNIQKCADILKDLPDAREQLVFWVNHVLKFGADHLRPVAADMPFWQFFMIDVALVIIVVVGIVSFTCCACCRFCCKKCRKTNKEKYE